MKPVTRKETSGNNPQCSGERSLAVLTYNLDIVCHALQARHPAHRLLDSATPLLALDGPVQGDYELAGACVEPRETACPRVSAERGSDELD